MTLQTTCPICHTVFRASNVALAGSKGMVQCGVCGMVFNAHQNAMEAEEIRNEVIQVDQQTEHAEQAIIDQTIDLEPEVTIDEPGSIAPDTVPDNELPITSDIDDVDVYNPDAETVTEDDEVIDQPVSAIQFRNKSSRRHILFWSAFSLLLFALFTLQFILFYRDKLAINLPSLKPALVSLCGIANCKIELPKDIDIVKISNSSFEADPKLPNLIAVRIGLENQSDMIIAYPDIALSLTNDQDEIVVRRNFKPAEYLHNQDAIHNGITAHGDATAKLVLDISKITVSGYKIQLFY